MNDVMPPANVFLHPPKPLPQLRGAETLYGFKEFSFPEYGFLAHYQGRPYPNKGMQTTGSMEANNTFKRLTIGLVQMVSLRPSTILLQYHRLADYLYFPHYLHQRYYNDCSRELFGLVYRFFRYLGFSFDLSYELGRDAASLLQFENGYRFRVEDIFTETTLQKLLDNPRAELKRLEQIYVSRETWNGVNSVGQSFRAIFKLLRLALLLPPIKKAFRFALVGSEFKNFQFDTIEKYWADRFREYNFGGEPYGIRQLKQQFKLYG
jgi:hypothetical protein